jgi:septum formation protein
VEFEFIAARIDEDALRAELLAKLSPPRKVAEELAAAKALAVSATRRDLVIGADQTLDLDGETLSKVRDLGEARGCLLRLRGHTHRLHSAIAIAKDGQINWRYVASPGLTMRRFSDAFLDHYLDRCGEAVLGSVGCYHLEGLGAQLFETVDGDYHAILGLPLTPLLAELRREGALPE